MATNPSPPLYANTSIAVASCASPPRAGAVRQRHHMHPTCSGPYVGALHLGPLLALLRLRRCVPPWRVPTSTMPNIVTPVMLATIVVIIALVFFIQQRPAAERSGQQRSRSSVIELVGIVRGGRGTRGCYPGQPESCASVLPGSGKGVRAARSWQEE